MNIRKTIVAICSLLFFMVGADKFLGFLEPPCSMQENFPPMLWMALGVLQIAGGILIWLPSFSKTIIYFFLAFMIFFSVVHLVFGTYDIGGSVSMAVLLGLLAWNPKFIRGRESLV